MEDLRSSLFGSVAVRAGLCTREQVGECLGLQEQYREAGKRVPRLGELLASRGYLSVEQVKAILTGEVTEPGKRFGEICATLRFCTVEQVKDALEEQSRLDSLEEGHKRLGEILLKKGYLKSEQLPPILQAQGIEIAECTKCRRSYNVRSSAGPEAWTCPSCGRDLIAVTGYENVTAVEEEALAEPAPPGAPAVVSEEPADELVVEEVEEVVLEEEEEREYGGFVVEEKLGSDVQGTLYKARHKETAQLATLKVYDVSRSRNEEFTRRFVEEARRAVGLDHPGLKKVAGAGKDRGQFYYASEFVAGKSLRRLIEEQKRLPTRVATHIVRQVAEALKYAHGKGMVHGEVRPSNIIVTHEGKVKLAGLGQAKDPKANILFLAREEGEVPLYVAPEQGTEGASVDHRADVYSLGATWYHMATGTPPFKGKAPVEILMRMAEEELKRPEAVEPKVQRPVGDIIMKMMAIEPDRRYQSMQALLLDLEKVSSLETGKFEPVEALSYPEEQARPEGGEIRRGKRRRSASRRATKIAETPREKERPSRAGGAARERERPLRAARDGERLPRAARVRRGAPSPATVWIVAALIIFAGLGAMLGILYYGGWFESEEYLEEGYREIRKWIEEGAPARPDPSLPPPPKEDEPPVYGPSLWGPRGPIDSRSRRGRGEP